MNAENEMAAFRQMYAAWRDMMVNDALTDYSVARYSDAVKYANATAPDEGETPSDEWCQAFGEFMASGERGEWRKGR
jgi:hypothetical protein